MSKKQLKSRTKWNKKDSDRQMKSFCQHLLVKRGLAAYTIDGYRRTISKVLRDVDSIRPTHKKLEKHMAWMYKQGYSYNHIVNTALAIERYMEFIKDPIAFGRPKKPKHIIPETLSEAEIAVILAACKNIREKAIIALVAYSGIRNKELCGLRLRDIDLGNNAIRVIDGKGVKDRVVCISGACVIILLEYLNEYPRSRDSFLFTTLDRDEQYTGFALRKLLKTVSGRTGIKKRVYPHLLRHSLATNLIERGASLITVKEQLGHAFIETTMIYVTSRFKRIMLEYNNFAPSYL